MSKLLQKFLLIAGVVALVILMLELAQSITATTHGSTPARVEHVQAGPYALQVNLYKDPANAGLAFPFSIASEQANKGTLTYDVTSGLSDSDVSATPVRATLTADSTTPNAVQGTAEVTVQGAWYLYIIVDGPQGKGTAVVPITVTAPPAIPTWSGWLIGLLPLIGLAVFLTMVREPRKTLRQEEEEPKKELSNYSNHRHVSENKIGEVHK